MSNCGGCGRKYNPAWSKLGITAPVPRPSQTPNPNPVERHRGVIRAPRVLPQPVPTPAPVPDPNNENKS